MCQYGTAVRIANQLSARARNTRPNDDIGMRMPAAKSLATRLLLLPTVELFCFGRVYAREQIAPKSQIKAKKHTHTGTRRIRWTRAATSRDAIVRNMCAAPKSDCRKTITGKTIFALDWAMEIETESTQEWVLMIGIVLCMGLWQAINLRYSSGWCCCCCCFVYCLRCTRKRETAIRYFYYWQ